MTIYEAIPSSLSIKINASSSFEIFNIIHNKIIAEWQTFWENIPFPNKLKNVKLFLKQLKYHPDTKRREEVTIIRAKMGHPHLTHAYPVRKKLAPA